MTSRFPKCARFERELYPFVETNYGGVLKTIREKKAFDDALRADMKKALDAFKERFKRAPARSRRGNQLKLS